MTSALVIEGFQCDSLEVFGPFLPHQIGMWNVVGKDGELLGTFVLELHEGFISPLYSPPFKRRWIPA